ncbi:MAG: hypothetical protein QXJ02_07400 [Candidatus Bathyarchaeia archaeon]
MRKAVTFAATTMIFMLCTFFAYAEVQVGVKAGDWVKCDLTSAPIQDMPQWVKIECLSVTGSVATVKVTMHMSNGTEYEESMTLDLASGAGNAIFQALIPANSQTGDTIKVIGYGDLTISGETTATYAGASRTVVYASLVQNDMQLTYHWDKQTGVLLEITLAQGSTSATFKATSTNIWQSSPPLLPFASPNLPIEYVCLSISIVAAIAIVATAIVYTKHKRS